MGPDGILGMLPAVGDNGALAKGQRDSNDDICGLGGTTHRRGSDTGKGRVEDKDEESDQGTEDEAENPAVVEE